MPGDASNPGADHLHRGHQRIEKQHHPEHLGPQLRASLRVRGYATRITICCAGDVSRSESVQQRGTAQPMCIRGSFGSSGPISDLQIVVPHSNEYSVVSTGHRSRAQTAEEDGNGAIVGRPDTVVILNDVDDALSAHCH